jgi:AraC-like DNA-binding protein
VSVYFNIGQAGFIACSIRENVIHQLDTNGGVQLLIYLDANSDVAKKMKTLYLADKNASSPNEKILNEIHPEELQRAVLGNNPTQLWELINRILNFLTQSPKANKGDKRVLEIIERITVTPPALLSIRFLAKTVYLSESRLCELFKCQVGVTLYKYLMWNRIRFGINQLMAGKSVGETALEVGFTDSSHFHKMLVQMFGIGPTAFLKNHRSLNMVTCEEVPIHFEIKTFDQHQRLGNIYSNT